MEDLKHYGVLGMKWGVRKSSPRLGFTQKRTKAMAEQDIKSITEGKKRMSIGFTKKRQEAYNQRDVRYLKDLADSTEVKNGQRFVSWLLLM